MNFFDVTVLLDPRVKALESKIRRSSADSGLSHQASKFCSLAKGSESKSTSIYNCDDAPTTPGDDLELDDRPGTPLCDENPESFEAPPPVQVTPLPNNISKHQQQPSGRKTEEPFSLPLHEFAHQRQNSRSGYGSPSHKSPKSLELSLAKAGSAGSGSKNSPGLSPPLPSVMTSARLSEKDLTLSSSAEKISPSSSISSSTKSTNVTDNITHPSPEAALGVGESEVKGGDAVEEKCSEEEKREEEVFEKEGETKDEEDVLISPPMSDYGGSPSPPLSPGGSSLEQRIALLYEKYDQWTSGSRTVGRSNSVGFSTSSSGGTDQEDSKEISNYNSRYGSYSDKPWFTRPRPLDFDELRRQTSDIAKTLIAKKSVFDEDSKRLENFSEKYDSKITCAPLTTAWRLSLTNRSTSSASNSSTTSSTPQTPNSATSNASSNVFPSTPTTPVSNSSRAVVFNNIPSPSPSATTCPNTSKPPTNQPAPPPAPAGTGLPKRKDLNWNLKAEPSPIPTTTTRAAAPAPAPTPGMTKFQNSTNTDSTSFPPPVSRCNSVTLPNNKSASSSSSSSQKPTGVCSSSSSSVQSSPENRVSRLSPQKSAPPPGIHQGIPRMVERSMSLDSKRALPNGPTQQPSAESGNANVNVQPSPAPGRRTSVDCGSGKEGPTKVEPEIITPRPKIKALVIEECRESKTLKEIINNNARPPPSLTILSSLPNHNHSKDKDLPAKFDVVKEDGRLGFHHLQEQTVAVVASIQSTPVLTPRTSGNSGNNGGSNSVTGKDKDSSGVNNNKKEKESNNNNNNNINNSGSGKSSRSTNNHNCKPDSSSSNKGGKEKKEKDKDKSTTNANPSSNTNGTKEYENANNTNTNSHHGSGGSGGGHHHKDKKKEKEPGAKEKEKEKEHGTSSVENVNLNLNSTASSSHGHKKERDGSSKVKRRMSSLEIESGKKYSQ